MNASFSCPFETFPALASLPVIHAFTGAVPAIDVKTNRATALQRLESAHHALRHELGFGNRRYVTAEQVHGRGVAVVHKDSPARAPAADALVTNDPSVCLGIYVADCGPVFLVDPARNVIACAHSGRKGTALGVVPAAIDTMVHVFGSNPSNIVAQLGPCIRPPNYEIDFAGTILRQCREAGLHEVHDCGACTAADPLRYYSYRREHGQTGRMLALIALAENPTRVSPGNSSGVFDSRGQPGAIS